MSIRRPGSSRKPRAHGAATIELNLEKSLGANAFHEARYGPATEVVTGFVAELKDRAAQ